MMTVIRDDENERLVRVEHMIDTIKKRREDVAAFVQESEQVVEEATRTRDPARTATAQLDATQKDADDAS
jgi:ABC-type transporter Mla subunit MlaD